jgi:hypothetical protein
MPFVTFSRGKYAFCKTARIELYKDIVIAIFFYPFIPVTFLMAPNASTERARQKYRVHLFLWPKCGQGFSGNARR